MVWAGTWRVGGVLAVSRSFGNRMMKQVGGAGVWLAGSKLCMRSHCVPVLAAAPSRGACGMLYHSPAACMQVLAVVRLPALPAPLQFIIPHPEIWQDVVTEGGLDQWACLASTVQPLPCSCAVRHSHPPTVRSGDPLRSTHLRHESTLQRTACWCWPATAAVHPPTNATPQATCKQPPSATVAPTPAFPCSQPRAGAGQRWAVGRCGQRGGNAAGAQVAGGGR